MPRPRLATTIAAVAGVLIAAVALFVLTREDEPQKPPAPLALDPGGKDPFVYTPGRRAEFERRATLGYSHVVYAKSPGGVAATAARVARWRPEVEKVASATGFDPDVIEAMIFLESAGRENAVADPKLEGAVGLTQILAETGSNLLAMEVDTARSRKLTRQITGAERRGQTARAARLRARRARVDERFDPRKSIAATGRYLEFARGELGRDDLAVASYHMGVGNLQSVVKDFEAEGGDARSYAEVFFDTSPTHRAKAWRRLYGLGDDSSTYLWRMYASHEIMRLYRADPAALAATAQLQTAKNSAEEVLHPEEGTTVFGDPGDLRAAYDERALRLFGNSPRLLGLRRDPQMGEFARRIDAEPRLYRGLRPEALALAVYASGMTRRAGGGNGSLRVTSTVRDREYQKLLTARNIEATRKYSLHTTGYAFDVLRRYRSRRQARAFQFTLDRLQALNLIAWVREPAAIHVTVSGEAQKLVRLLRADR